MRELEVTKNDEFTDKTTVNGQEWAHLKCFAMDEARFMASFNTYSAGDQELITVLRNFQKQ